MWIEKRGVGLNTSNQYPLNPFLIHKPQKFGDKVISLCGKTHPFTTKTSHSLYSFPSFNKMASTTIITPTSTNTTTKPLLPNKPKHTTTNVAIPMHRREFFSLAASAILAAPLLLTAKSAAAASDEEYVKDTKEVIGKVRTTITMDKKDPTVADAVAQLRDSSNSWVAKYRKEKGLLGRTSFRDMYSALNAVSGHYISFGPTAPIPAKRRARILEEMDTAEKALLRGR